MFEFAKKKIDREITSKCDAKYVLEVPQNAS